MLHVLFVLLAYAFNMQVQSKLEEKLEEQLVFNAAYHSKGVTFLARCRAPCPCSTQRHNAQYVCLSRLLSIQQP